MVSVQGTPSGWLNVRNGPGTNFPIVKKIYDRDEFMRVLYREEGVQGILHYQPSYHFTGLKKLGITGSCPIAEEFFYKRELNLPMHPRLTQGQLDDMVEGIRKTARKLRADSNNP